MDKRKTKPQKQGRKSKKFNAKRFFIWTFFTAAAAIFCALAAYLFIILNGESLLKENIKKMDMDETSIIYDVNGDVATKLFRENRDVASLSDMPELLPKAFIATEDKRFTEHEGIDYRAVGRALVQDVIHRSAVEGGSTITQQLAKNIFLSNEKTLFRKAKELSIAISLENNYGKDEILEMYLNRIYFGKGVYGVKTAATKYFPDTPFEQLKLWQIATLAGIPKSPENYNPMNNAELSQERRAVVLSLMYEQGLITEEERNQAAEVQYTAPQITEKSSYQAYIDFVEEEVERLTGLKDEDLRRGGYKIYTTLDTKAQAIVEQAFEKDNLFPKGTSEEKHVEGSMVIVNHKNGGIVAMAGGREYTAKGINFATIKRQPGSSFKPIVVYGPALESGDWTPNSKLKNKKTSFGDYAPRNYDNRYSDEVTMTEAARQSINVATVWLLNEIGIKKGMQFAEDLGMPLGSEDRNLAIALGGLTYGVTPIQMAAAYGAFPQLGEFHEAHAIIKILDSEDKEIYYYKPVRKQVMSDSTAWYMTQMLQGVVQSGTGKAARMNRPVAGKTGTTQVPIRGVDGNRDAWFVGYTPEWSAAIWMGYDNPKKDEYLVNGSSFPAKMFAEVMTEALAGHKASTFKRPEGFEEVQPPKENISDLTASYSEQDHSVLLTWSAKEKDMEYHLYRKGSQEQDYSLILTTTANTVNDISAMAGEAYQYYVTYSLPAKEEESDKSNVVEVAVPVEQTETPGDSLGQNEGDGSEVDGEGQGEFDGTGEEEDEGEEGEGNSEEDIPNDVIGNDTEVTLTPTPTPDPAASGEANDVQSQTPLPPVTPLPTLEPVQ